MGWDFYQKSKYEISPMSITSLNELLWASGKNIRNIIRFFFFCKGILNPNMRILSSFIHLYVVPNQYDLHFSAEHYGILRNVFVQTNSYK